MIELTPLQRYRNAKREQGICIYCVQPAVPGITACEVHRYKHRNQAYKDRRNTTRRRRKREDPAWAMADRLRKRVGRAIRDYAPGMKLRQTKQYIGCDMDTFMAHIESLFVEGMSWDNRHCWHLDHIRPCSSFDLTDPEQQKQCFHYTNLQPLWARDNLIKNDTYEPVGH